MRIYGFRRGALITVTICSALYLLAFIVCFSQASVGGVGFKVGLPAWMMLLLGVGITQRLLADRISPRMFHWRHVRPDELKPVTDWRQHILPVALLLTWTLTGLGGSQLLFTGFLPLGILLAVVHIATLQACYLVSQPLYGNGSS